MKWKGFPDEANTDEKQTDISTELVKDFDAVYAERGGNHPGVELLDKRTSCGKAESLMECKERPETENSGEKKLIIKP